jgi:arylsulfatase A-like enzyme
MDEISIGRRNVLAAGVGLATASLFPRSALAEVGARAPNVVFIMADDLGFADVGCYGRRDVKTANIDRLASEGMKFTQAYANSAVCSATRVALLTGRYQYRLAVGLNEPIGLTSDIGMPASHPTLPSLFRAGGYETILIGKWHLGPPPKYGPLMSGYERFYGIYGGAADYFRHSPADGAGPFGVLIDQDKPAEDKGYITELLGNRAAREIVRSAASGKPFFMSLHFTATHWPWEGPEDREASKDVTNPLDFERGSMAVYAQMVESLDDNVGKVLDTLARLGIADNTIVVFTSDNGGERFSDTWPLSGRKTELLEGGIRVPLLVRWPTRIAPGSASTQVMLSMDFLPTLLAAAGLAPDPAFPSDGENLLAQLAGTPSRNRQVYWRYKAQEQRAYRNGDWKYLLINGREFLFDLSEDQTERANKKTTNPKKFEQMKREFSDWDAGMLPYSNQSSSHNIKEDEWADRY